MTCLGAASFHPKLNKSAKRDGEHAVYPYEEGDYVILGPDVLATRDGSALNWRGVVYIRAEPLTSVDPLDIV